MALSRSMKNLMHDQYASQRGSAYGSSKPARPQLSNTFGQAVSTMARTTQPRGGIGGMVKQAVDTKNLAKRSDIGVQAKPQPLGRRRPGFSFLDQAQQRPAFSEQRQMRGGSRRFLR